MVDCDVVDDELVLLMLLLLATVPVFIKTKYAEAAARIKTTATNAIEPYLAIASRLLCLGVLPSCSLL